MGASNEDRQNYWESHHPPFCKAYSQAEGHYFRTRSENEEKHQALPKMSDFLVWMDAIVPFEAHVRILCIEEGSSRQAARGIFL
jgi:hypothetical protein